MGTPSTYTSNQVLAMLSTQPQPALPWYARWFAFLTTPFKFLGLDGWTDTQQNSSGSGALVRDIQHSTDGFYTADLKLEDIKIGNSIVMFPVNSYMRLEVEPGTKAHEYCNIHRKELVAGKHISFGGEVYIDADGPFLEVHPTDSFSSF